MRGGELGKGDSGEQGLEIQEREGIWGNSLTRV